MTDYYTGYNEGVLEGSQARLRSVLSALRSMADELEAEQHDSRDADVLRAAVKRLGERRDGSLGNKIGGSIHGRH